MLYVKLITVLFAAVVLQGLVPNYWSPFRYVDLFLLVTVYFALMRDPVLGMVVGSVAGLGGDLAPGAGPVLGVGGFSKTVIGYLVASVAKRFSLEGALVRVLVIGISSVVNSLLFIGLYDLMDYRATGGMAGEAVAIRVALQTAANLICGVIIFWVFDKMFPDTAPGSQMKVRRRYYD